LAAVAGMSEWAMVVVKYFYDEFFRKFCREFVPNKMKTYWTNITMIVSGITRMRGLAFGIKATKGGRANLQSNIEFTGDIVAGRCQA
jgi:hypothetical protein